MSTLSAALEARDKATPGFTLSGCCSIIDLWTQLKYVKFADNLNRTAVIHHVENVKLGNRNSGEQTTQIRRKNKKRNGVKEEASVTHCMRQNEKELNEQEIQNTIVISIHKDLNGCVLEMSRQNNLEIFTLNLRDSASIASLLFTQDSPQAILVDLITLFLAFVVDSIQYQIWLSAVGTVTLSNQGNDAIIAAAPDAIDWIAKALPWMQKRKAELFEILEKEYTAEMGSEFVTLDALIAQAERVK